MGAHVFRQDAYGHVLPNLSNNQAANLVAGAVSTTAVGTIAPTTSAGASPTVTFATGTGAQRATDQGGSFTLNPVTGGGAQAAGAQVVVTFQNPFEVVPAAVLVTVVDNAAGTGAVPVAASAQSVTAAGFTINTAALTTAHNYTVNYHVVS